MINRAIKFLRKNYLDYFFVLIIAFVILLYIQSTITLPDPDSFYHAKMAQLIKEQGMVQSFPWTQFSTLKDNYIDQHFLYHLYLIPFTLFFKPLIAIKIATVFLDLFLILIFYGILSHFKVRWRLIWVLILLTVNPFLFRISLAKAPALSLIILLLGFYALVNYRIRLLFFLSFFYVWAYGGWPLLWVVCTIYFIVDYFYDHLKKESLFWQTIKLIISPIHPLKKKMKRWKLAGALFLGTIVGLIINPYFPKNIYFYYQQIYQIAIVNLHKIIGVGGEWYPYNLVNLFRDTSPLFPFLILAVILFFLSLKKQSRLSYLLFFLTLFFFFYTLKARRSVEYFVPFGLLFIGFCFNDFLQKTKNLAYRHIKFWFTPRWHVLIILYFLGILFVFAWLGGQNIRNVRGDFAKGIKLNYLEKAGDWLNENSAPGSIVFHSDWDEFPILFYYTDHNYFINGLDQTFMYNYDKNLFWRWVNITLGEKPPNLKEVVKADFRADYIFITEGHEAMENIFSNNPDFKLVYQDSQAKIYQVK